MTPRPPEHGDWLEPDSLLLSQGQSLPIPLCKLCEGVGVYSRPHQMPLPCHCQQRRCPHCQGSGKFRPGAQSERGSATEEMKCGACNGYGYQVYQPYVYYAHP